MNKMSNLKEKMLSLNGGFSEPQPHLSAVSSRRSLQQERLFYHTICVLFCKHHHHAMHARSPACMDASVYVSLRWHT